MLTSTNQALCDHFHAHMPYQARDVMTQVANVVCDGISKETPSRVCSLTLVGERGSGKSMTTQHLKWFFGDEVPIIVVPAHSDLHDLMERLPKQLIDAAYSDPWLIILSVDDMDRGPYDTLQYIATLMDTPSLMPTKTTLLTVFTCSGSIKIRDESITKALGHVIHYAPPTYINEPIYFNVSSWW